MKIVFFAASALSFFILCISQTATAATMEIVAAENFYADIAQQVGGPRVNVTNILNNPGRDPHLFEANASSARAIAGAQIVIMNGAGYDPWIRPLLMGSRSNKRHVIRVDTLVHYRPGDNLHLWYSPTTMPTLARKLARLLSEIDPSHTDDYMHRLRVFTDSLKPLQRKLSMLRARYGGTPVAATEPVFGYMADVLGLEMHEKAFQAAMMNGTEPTPSQVIRFETDLTRHRVRILIYNRQVADQRTARLRNIAQEAGIPAVGVTETKPPQLTYQEWMIHQLTVLQIALRNVTIGSSEEQALPRHRMANQNII